MAQRIPQIQRFIQAINQSLTVNSWTQRELCEQMGITIGSMSKYLAGKVDPNDVKFRVQAALARTLGLTADSLFHFYESGEYHSAITLADVQEYLRTQVQSTDLPAILKDVADASARLNGQTVLSESENNKIEPLPQVYNEEEANQLSQQAMVHFRECAQVEMLTPKEAWQQLKLHAQAEGMTTHQIERFREVVSGWDVWNAEEVNALAPYGEFGAPGRALRRLSGSVAIKTLAVPGSGGAVVTVQSGL